MLKTSFMGRPRVWNASNNVMGISNVRSSEKNEFEIKNKNYTNMLLLFIIKSLFQIFISNILTFF
ncbi:hypothetical protein B7P27_27725 [Bacillus cereus]|nr:hypothetical protein B7P27_27725 [Bacillus cereus]